MKSAWIARFNWHPRRGAYLPYCANRRALGLSVVIYNRIYSLQKREGEQCVTFAMSLEVSPSIVFDRISTLKPWAQKERTGGIEKDRDIVRSTLNHCRRFRSDKFLARASALKQSAVSEEVGFMSFIGRFFVGRLSRLSRLVFWMAPIIYQVDNKKVTRIL